MHHIFPYGSVTLHIKRPDESSLVADFSREPSKIAKLTIEKIHLNVYVVVSHEVASKCGLQSIAIIFLGHLWCKMCSLSQALRDYFHSQQ